MAFITQNLLTIHVILVILLMCNSINQFFYGEFPPLELDAAPFTA